jgi:ubiquinone/menaquinone biosynthesis C-methylase UbiE
MSIEQAYNEWAQQYDSNQNKTRDLEAIAFRKTLATISFEKSLEIGCGTGKNTKWLVEHCNRVTAVDFSEAMLAVAKQNIVSQNVDFIKADILNEWTFTNSKYDLISFSLVLEHIKNLESIFKKASNLLNKNGYVYIGEFHPFKQYLGSKARYESENGINILECYTHHLSEFIQAAKKHNLQLVTVHEYFDEEKTDIPRILVLLFQKK